MLDIEPRDTVRSMSIRAAISGLLTGDDLPSDPAAALEEAGYDNIPAEAFGTALTHFSDTATLAEADALAPVVTRAGPVPLDESDLPEIGDDVEPGDAFSLFGQTVTAVHQDYGETDLDEFDEVPDSNSALEDPDSTNTGDEVDLRFGESSSQPQAEDESFDEGDLDEDSFGGSSDSSLSGGVEPTTPFDDALSEEPFESEDGPESPDTPGPEPEPTESDDTFDDDLDFDL